MTNVVLDDMGIPPDVLYNRVPGFGSVHQTYKSVLYSEYMDRIHRSFADRAFWGSDEYGNTWTQLKPYTDLIKEEEMITQAPYNDDDAYHQHRDGFLQPQFPANPNDPTESQNTQITHKRKLVPMLRNDPKRKGMEGADTVNQVAIYRDRMDKMKSELNPKSIRQRARLALKNMPKNDGSSRTIRTGGRFFTVRRTPINIRSGRLFAAFFPAEVSNNRIYPASPDQDVYFSGLNFGFSIENIPYAENVEEGTQLNGNIPTDEKGKVIRVPKRVLIPKHLEPDGVGFQDCHRIAIQAARRVYDQILAKRQPPERESNDIGRPPAPRRREN